MNVSVVNAGTIVGLPEQLMDEQLQWVENCVTCLASLYHYRQSQANSLHSELVMGDMRQPIQWRIPVDNLAMSEQIKIPHNQSRMDRRGRNFPTFILSE